MSAGITLSGITINAPDAIELARFYARITDGEAIGGPQWACVNGPGGCLEFQGDDDFQTPTWPMGTVPMHLHLDFLVDDLAATEIRVVNAGAYRFDVQPNVDHCVVFADPAGHPFCLTTWDPSRAAAESSTT